MGMDSSEARTTGRKTRPSRRAPLKPKNGLNGPPAIVVPRSGHPSPGKFSRPRWSVCALGGWRLNGNGQLGSENERQEDSAQPQSPTQAKERLEWATQPGEHFLVSHR
jgi:hypothetical protein